jgi:hypothetical protein
VRDKNLVSVFYKWLVFPTPFVEETVFSPMFVFGFLVENQMIIAMWVYFWVFYSIPSVCMSVFVPVP